MNGIVADIPPNCLYKYRSFDKHREGGIPFEWDRSIILNSVLWAGSPLQFNDPYDCYPLADLEGTVDERMAWVTRMAPTSSISTEEAFARLEAALADPAMRAQISDWRKNAAAISVLSLTERADDMLMWAHYAESHRGYCLELDATAQPFLLAYRVSYGRERPSFRVFDSSKADAILPALLHKADFWAHEREWRIVRPMDEGPVAFPPQSLKSIILGAGILPEDEAALRSIVAERKTPLDIRRAKLNERDYRLDIIDA